MAELTAEQLAQRAFDVGLLDQRQLDTLWGELGSREVSGEALRSLLVRRELLTNFQLERLLKGDRAGYFYGDYKVLYLVGAGTFARVYRAVHKTSGKIVAIKVLRKRYADNPAMTEQFLREAELGTRLRHPHVCTIYEVHSEPKLNFMAMEFVEGQSLRDFVRVRGKVEPGEATRLIAEICAGLSHAFEKGVSHRDLKLSNVLVTSVGKGKLVDFGLGGTTVALNEESVENCPNPRTIDYAGMERVAGVRKDDLRSDIYFVGCIYYHMLTGIAPLFETKDRVARLSTTRFLEVVPINEHEPTLPAVVVKIVNKAMELNVKKRYQTPAEMLGDLKLATKRLAAVSEEEAISLTLPSESPAAVAAAQQAEAEAQEGVGRTLMVVESSVVMQNALREKLKEKGYRVLVVSDPDRALQRFEMALHGEFVADCVIFLTHQLGERSVDGFNKFGLDVATRDIPAIALLGEKQEHLRSQLQLSPQRVTLSMPLRMKELRATLLQLMGPAKTA